MYETLTITLMNLSLWKGIIIGIGIGSFLCSIVSFATYITGNNSATKDKILLVCCFGGIFLIICSFVAYNNKWLDSNWRIALEVSKRIDKYVDQNPGSIYDPDRLLTEVDKTIVSVFESVQRVPGIIQKLTNGQTMEVIKAEINAQREREQFEAFKAWQESQPK